MLADFPMWPALSNPDWLRPETEGLAARLGRAHADVLFFTGILDAGSIDEACLGRVTEFLSRAITDDAVQIALRLSMDCIQTIGVDAAAEDANPESHTLHCARIGRPKADPQQCRDRKEALAIAHTILSSPQCPADIWVRIESAGGLAWETAEIRQALAMRATVHAS